MLLSWEQVLGRRLERHGLDTLDGVTTPAEVARRICGAHAQVMAAAELSIALRTASGTQSDVRRALWADRSLVKTFGPRGTVHLLPASDLRMWTGALASVPMGSDGLPPDLRLDAAQTDELVDAIGLVLADGELTIDELGAQVVAAAGAWAGALVIPAFDGLWPRWRRALIPAARRGVLCFGPDRGRNVTYTSPRRWLPGFVPDDADHAIGDLLLGYLSAYGPATSAQFAQWLAAPRRWATQLFERLGSALVEVDVEGARGYLPAGELDLPATPARGIRLLPYFDAYTVGCHPRERLFPGLAAQRALSRGQAGNVPVLLVDGIVGGIWHQRRSGGMLHVQVEPFQSLDVSQRIELEAQVERVARIQEIGVRWTVGSVQAGKHL